MIDDTSPERSTADMAAIMIALLRAANSGQNVGEEIYRIGGELRIRSCHTMEEALAFLSIARTIYARAAGMGVLAAEDKAFANRVIPLMNDGDFYFHSAVHCMQTLSTTMAPPIGMRDTRMN